MTMFRSARAALAGAAVIALAGCASASSTGSTATGSTATGKASSPATADGTATSAGTPSASPGGSLAFPVAVGNTWTYQTVSSVNNEQGLVTNRVLSVTPVPGGRRVTMSSTVVFGQTTKTTQQNYVFYDNGTVGYPVDQVGGLSVLDGSGVLWPNAAALASGQAYHSVLRVRLSSTSSARAANVTVQGGGTQPVTVPAGSYQATVVTMNMVMMVGNFTTTAVVKTWDAPGTGPVKTEETIQAAGKTTLITTESLLTFTKG
jgi:hypothetical protein